MRRIALTAAAVTAGMAAGIVFTSSASAEPSNAGVQQGTTAAAFAEAAAKPENVVDPSVQPRSWASFLKKAAGSAAGSAAYDYVKAVGAIPKNKSGRQFRRGDVAGYESPSHVDLSRSFD